MSKKILSCFLGIFCSFVTCFAEHPKITVKWMEKNPCWTSEHRTIKPKSIMVHSTASPGVMAPAWHKLWNKPLWAGGREVAVHAFVDDKSIMQYLPWCLRAWHCGRGEKGSGNNTHISIEMCEPESVKYSDPSTIDLSRYNPKDPENRKYFNAALKNMVELCAHLCEQFEIDPKDIICHKEGYQSGIASNHADVLHWWPLHGLTMDKFRGLVEQEMSGETVVYDF